MSSRSMKECRLKGSTGKHGKSAKHGMEYTAHVERSKSKSSKRGNKA